MQLLLKKCQYITISSLPWEGSQNLTGQTVVSKDAIRSCFDSEITFTFTGEGTVSYYDNNDRETSLGTVTSGTAITLNDDLRAHGHGIYIRCTSGVATLTAISHLNYLAIGILIQQSASSVSDRKQGVAYDATGVVIR